PELTRPYYTLPADKVRVIPHPSYVGVYPADTTRDAARAALGLGAGETVLAALGAVRRYKGIGSLLDAFDAARRANPRLRLIVAGRPIRFPGFVALKRRCERNPAILSRFEGVPDEELQLYLAAADVVVLPYADVLNSGIVMLAATFGRPVIAPDCGCVGAIVGEELGIRFKPDSPGALEQALLRVDSLKDPRHADAARRFAESLAPRLVSERFSRALREAAIRR
ncbi:MAG: glycosyltransferase, partial [Candidatus Binatia bacterium]